MNQVWKQRAPAAQRKRAVLVAILCSGLTATAGCGIPGLRRAQCGPVMPPAYNWNNGSAFWNANDTTQPAMPVDSPQSSTDHDNDAEAVSIARKENVEDESKQAEEQDSPRSFSSLIRAVNFLAPDKQDDEKKTSIDDEINRMESEVADVNATRPRVDPNGLTDKPVNNLGTSPDDIDLGMIEAESVPAFSGPTDLDFGVSSLDNSAQLPHAAFYSDPFLLELISGTLTGNQELKILAEEINIACNESYARSGEYRPFVTLGAGAGFEKAGRHTREGAVEDQLEVAPGTEFPDPLGDFAVGASASWELDIWKKLRNSQRAAAMRYLGTREGRNFIVTRVVAEVAENYYELLALDNRLQTLQATIEIQQQSLKVAQAKKVAGRATELAVKRFQAEVEKNASERSLIQQEIVEIENRINFLAGRYPQRVDRINIEFVDLNLNTLGAGVPSELLHHRADIREAERQVAAAGLDVKVARARFYPSLSLTAGLGWNAFSTGYLFRTPESLIYGMAGELVGPLINKRAIKADYCSANAAQLQAIYNYQQTVLEAHIEVVNQITKVENYRRAIEVKKRQIDALQASVDAASKLFQNARAEYVEVLLAQREMMEAKMQLIEIKQEQLSAIVNAYQALGGGGF